MRTEKAKGVKQEREMLDVRTTVPVKVEMQYPSGNFVQDVEWKDREAVKRVTNKIHACLYQGGQVVLVGLTKPIYKARG